MEIEKHYRKMNENKSYFFGIKKKDFLKWKDSSQSDQDKGQKIQITSFRNETGDIMTDSTEIKLIISKYE